MKGLILVGGLGTQLRPLTLSKAKPLIEFGNKPQLLRLLDLLKQAGVTEAVLAINYRPEIMADFLESYGRDGEGIKITLSQEREPLGTAGPLALAKDLLNDGEPFFVMNCDIACEFNLRELVEFHRAHGKVGTIMVTPVNEPAKYGKSVVVPFETGLIDKFVEHGRTFAGNLINAGVYIFSPSIFDRIALRPTSMEKEVLPSLAADEQLYCKQLDGWWMNIKKPPSFLQGTSFYLDYLRKHRPAELLPLGGTCCGNVLMDPSATVGKGCKLGPDVVIGPGCVVEDGARLSRCIMLEGSRVCQHANVLDSILGWKSTIGRWTRVEGVSVLGEDVQIGSELAIFGALILPHKVIDSNVTEPQIIM
jgi:mannose-1-phosphate guanylyltransferase